MATNAMFGSTVRTVKDASGNVVGLGVGGETVLRFAKRPEKSYSAAVSVMASPPTISQATTSTSAITDALLWPSKDGTELNPVFDCAGLNPAVWATNNNYMVPYSTALDMAQPIKYGFWTDSANVEFRLLNYNTRVQVFVDGSPIQAAHFSLTAVGNTELLLLEFADSQPRFIEIVGYNFPFGGVYTDPTASVWREAVDNPIIYVIGDSYTLGTGASSFGQTWFATAARMLGFDYAADGIGSTGYLTASPNTPAERITKRVPRLTRLPSVVLLALGYNDAGGNQTTISAEAVNAISAIRSSAPSAQIVMLSPWTPQGSTTNLTAVKTTLSAVAVAAGVDFVDIDSIINMTNEATYTGVDNAHPTAVGHQYLGSRIANLLSGLA